VRLHGLLGDEEALRDFAVTIPHRDMLKD
jgi:hypothetical protein